MWPSASSFLLIIVIVTDINIQDNCKLVNSNLTKFINIIDMQTAPYRVLYPRYLWLGN